MHNLYLSDDEMNQNHLKWSKIDILTVKIRISKQFFSLTALVMTVLRLVHLIMCENAGFYRADFFLSDRYFFEFKRSNFQIQISNFNGQKSKKILQSILLQIWYRNHNGHVDEFYVIHVLSSIPTSLRFLIQLAVVWKP